MVAVQIVDGGLVYLPYVALIAGRRERIVMEQWSNRLLEEHVTTNGATIGDEIRMGRSEERQ